ncbi:MAG: NAD(P)-dependent glycerol-3-phosphate dehydrogenase [Candidatus Marinimicrobia bacterium]|nr:NAD(P)-dependent glycerol-3-phosphate dehydrogenase [Candidatus Neomarinimicrobiota bacterium]
MGAGTWGTVMAAHLHQAGHGVVLWHYRAEFAHDLSATRRHPHLEEFELPRGIPVTSNLEKALSKCDIAVVAIPSQKVRAVLGSHPALFRGRRVANLTKGIEVGTLQRMSEVIASETGLSPDRIASIYGPSHAEEVMRQAPTTLVAASTNLDYARELQKVFSTRYLRVYANRDIIGVELGGSVKNVIAIAAGISTGLGFGDNTLAALTTRGLAEITRLGLAMGADAATFAGLSGVGDLAVTVYSRHSRNRQLGLEMGRGGNYQEILAEMGMVAEGVGTARSVMGLAEKYGVSLPICQEVYQILFEGKDPRSAISALMSRDLRDETLD